MRPNFGETYYSLANLKTFRFTEQDVETMTERLADDALPVDCRVHFAFSLGKAFEDDKNYDEAFGHYALANQMHRETIAYDPVQTGIAHERMREIFSSAFFELRRGVRGVFRLSADLHFGVAALGFDTPRADFSRVTRRLTAPVELPDISMIAQGLTQTQVGASVPPVHARPVRQRRCWRWVSNTWSRRADTDDGAPFFTDKMPNNFAYVGFIKTILPNAKIIDARRHPMDSCFGCFKQHFAKGQTFTYDLFELGEFYLEYCQLMDHWDEVLPGQVLRVQYEEVVADLETQVRRILAFCELPFEEGVCRLPRDKTVCANGQFRAGAAANCISGSVQTWKRYGAHLDSLKEILEPVFPDLPETMS